MSALKPVSCLRSLVLTPQKVPSFIIPSRSPLGLGRRSPDRTRLLSDSEEDGTGASPMGASPSRFLLRRPWTRTPREAAAADTDLTTQAAMSLAHVGQVTTPYGFGAVLAASPCTRRRESLFHRNKPDPPPAPTTPRPPPQDPWASPSPGPGPGPGPGRSRVSLRPVRAFGLQVMKELKRPAAALKEVLSPAHRGTRPL